MRILGAILAGGKSTRFGSDKALAVIDGRMLIEHAIHAIAGCTERVAICGRAWPNFAYIPDRPEGGLGPLAGLNGALHHAAEAGFEAVLCAPVDVHPLPKALGLFANQTCAVLRSQRAIGLWPVTLAPALDCYLADGGRSIRGWLEAARPTTINDDRLSLGNINTEADISTFRVSRIVE